MYEELNNTERQPAPEASAFDTTRWKNGYFPYDAPTPTPTPMPRPLNPTGQTDLYPPQRTDAYPSQRTDAYPPQRTDTYPPQRTDAYPSQRTDAYPPQRTDAYPSQRTDAYPPQRTDAYPPQRTNAYPPQRADDGRGYGDPYAAQNGLRTPPGMAYQAAASAARRAAERPPPLPSSYSPPPKQRRGGALWVVLLLLFAVLAGGGTAYYIVDRAISNFEDHLADLEASLMDSLPTLAVPETPTPEPTPTPVTPSRPGNALSAEEIFELGRRQVVGITTEITTTNIFGQATTGQVSGSGFILSEDGYILTNYHVIEGATRILVMLDDYSMHEARLIGGEGVTSDIAVLKIDATHLDLTAASIGNSSEMRVGSPIYAIGNPLGELTFTFTAGVVSALNREVAVAQGQTMNMFQTDAAVNSGNSGGPMYNEFGQVVGVVTAKSALDGVEGIGFAIPIDDAMRYANQLIERGYIPQPYLGIHPVTVTESYAYYFGTEVGVFVNTVYPGSAAERGGILEGDVIIAMGGREIRTVEDLRAALSNFAPGDTVVITVFREGEHRDLAVTLGDRPSGGGADGETEE